MSSLQVYWYSHAQQPLWDAFIRSARNATFMFERAFMDYHADRFADHSVVVLKNEEIQAVLPANIKENIIYSHQGLSYGGLVVSSDCTLVDYLAIGDALFQFLQKEGIDKVIYKALPGFYLSQPWSEEEYLLFLHKAEKTSVALNSILDLTKEIQLDRDRKRMLQKAAEQGLVILWDNHFEPFWSEILIPTRWETHKVIPAHTAQEMALLQSRFPNQILHANIYQNQQLVGGGTIFVTPQVVHTQYIACLPEGRKMGVNDFFIQEIIQKYQATHRWLSFGISTDQNGQNLNEGLLYWKNSFGAFIYPHHTYTIPIQNT